MIGRSRLAIAAFVIVLAAAVRADDISYQHMRFIERGDNLTLTTNIPQLFDESAYQALASGFQSTVVIDTAVYGRDSDDLVQLSRSVRTAIYDEWDEIYIVQIDQRPPVKVKFQSEALKLLYTIDGMPIARLADLPYQQVYYLKLTASLNPLDKETLTEVKRWLSHGTGAGLDHGGVFFGSFVSVFVNPKIAKADRILRLESQPFYRAKP